MPEFSLLNYVILTVYLLGVVAVGLLCAGRQTSTEDYFLAGRRMPWLAVAMSMYASLTSAVTFMGLPGIAYRTNITLIVVCVISPLLAPVLVSLFYPFYRSMRVTTSYEYIDRRFGRRARLSIAGLFLLARLGWLGTVIYAPALALSAVTPLSLSVSILLMGLLATFYTALGGLAAVLWTDVIQFIILIGGAIWILCSIVLQLPDGWSTFYEMGRASGRMTVNGGFSLTEMTILVVGVSFFFQMMQDYGTDQVTVQRLLSVRSARGVVKAVFFNAIVDFFIVGILLLIGVGLFVFYALHPGVLPDQLSGDQILPFYIVHQLPNGISGLMIAAIFAAAMSSMDSGINSMSTVVVHDFIRPVLPAHVQEDSLLRLARILTVIFGLFATGIAFYVSTLEGIIEAFASFMGLFSAPVLALFILGMLVPRGRFAAWVAGAACSIPLMYWIQHATDLNWTYYFPVAFLLTFSISLAGSLLWPGRTPAPHLRALTVWKYLHKP